MKSSNSTHLMTLGQRTPFPLPPSAYNSTITDPRPARPHPHPPVHVHKYNTSNDTRSGITFTPTFLYINKTSWKYLYMYIPMYDYPPTWRGRAGKPCGRSDWTYMLCRVGQTPPPLIPPTNWSQAKIFCFNFFVFCHFVPLVRGFSFEIRRGWGASRVFVMLQ